jgi:hypothetical protein
MPQYGTVVYGRVYIGEKGWDDREHVEQLEHRVQRKDRYKVI